MRLKTPLRAEVDSGRFAAQCRRPVGLAGIDRAAGIAAQPARETKQQEFPLAALCCQTCLVDQTAPAFVRNMMVDQLGQFETPLLRCSATVLLSMQQLLTFVIRHQLPK